MVNIKCGSYLNAAHLDLLVTWVSLSINKMAGGLLTAILVTSLIFIEVRI